MLTMSEIRALANSDTRHVRSNLSIVYVLHRAGLHPAASDNGRLSYHSPWRQDNKPSLDVWLTLDGTERAGDFATNWTGDVFDVLARFSPSKSFGELVQWGSRLLAKQEADGWVGPVWPERTDFDKEVGAEAIARSVGKTEALTEFLLGRKDFVRDLPMTWLVNEFRLGSIGSYVVAPYFDRDDNLVSYKYRKADAGSFVSAPGANAYKGVLYGDWRYPKESTKPILLCEGETDTWVAAWKVGDVYDVYGLPTGAGTHPYGYESRFRSRRVVLAFDGDAAGDQAAQQWAAELTRLSTVHRPMVAWAVLPRGSDIASLPDLETHLPIPS